MKAFTIMGRVFKAGYDELFLCVGTSLLWWLGCLLVVTAAPATMGLHNAANRIANYKRTGSEFFWEAFRRQVGRGWLLFLLSLLAPVAIGFNVWFYSQAEGFLRLVSVVWLWGLLFWLLLAQYLIPLFLQQDEVNVCLALRNAALLVVRYPLFSFLMLLFQLTLIALSFALVLPLVLLLPALIALSQNLAMIGILQEMDLVPQPPTQLPR
jgi:uncharacterized membrane protein YesL